MGVRIVRCGLGMLRVHMPPNLYNTAAAGVVALTALRYRRPVSRSASTACSIAELCRGGSLVGMAGWLLIPPNSEGADPTLQATGSCWRFNLDCCIPGSPFVHCWDASMMLSFQVRQASGAGEEVCFDGGVPGVCAS